MVVSLEDAITILSKWKDDSATILVAAESLFRLHLRDIHDPGVDWTMGIRGRVAQAEFSPGPKGAKAGIVVFEGSSGRRSFELTFRRLAAEAVQAVKIWAASRSTGFK